MLKKSVIRLFSLILFLTLCSCSNNSSWKKDLTFEKTVNESFSSTYSYEIKNISHSKLKNICVIIQADVAPIVGNDKKIKFNMSIPNEDLQQGESLNFEINNSDIKEEAKKHYDFYYWKDWSIVGFKYDKVK